MHVPRAVARAARQVAGSLRLLVAAGERVGLDRGHVVRAILQLELELEGAVVTNEVTGQGCCCPTGGDRWGCWRAPRAVAHRHGGSCAAPSFPEIADARRGRPRGTLAPRQRAAGRLAGEPAAQAYRARRSGTGRGSARQESPWPTSAAGTPSRQPSLAAGRPPALHRKHLAAPGVAARPAPGSRLRHGAEPARDGRPHRVVARAAASVHVAVFGGSLRLA